MRWCTICHFAAEADDVALELAHERCICLRCYGRETGSARPMPKGLRRSVTAVIDAKERNVTPTPQPGDEDYYGYSFYG